MTPPILEDSISASLDYRIHTGEKLAMRSYSIHLREIALTCQLRLSEYLPAFESAGANSNNGANLSRRPVDTVCPFITS